MNQIRVPLIHFDHSTESGHNNDGKDPNIVEPEKHLQQKNEKILIKNLTSSSNISSSFIANEHLIVDILTAVVASNSVEVERQNEDDIAPSAEREKDVQDENEQNSSSSLPSTLKSEIIQILVLTFLIVNLIVYII